MADETSVFFKLLQKKHQDHISSLLRLDSTKEHFIIMRAAYSAVVLGAIGASAAAVPEVEARAATATAGNWYFYSFDPSCGSSFGCNTDYIIFAPEGAAGAGAPAFGLRVSRLSPNLTGISRAPIAWALPNPPLNTIPIPTSTSEKENCPKKASLE